MSIRRNFLYNSILTVSTYLFPLLVYPYVSRTLGLSKIGIVNFVDGIINYAVLISMMGISTVGVREIASSKGNKEKLSCTFNSLFFLTLITTIISITVLFFTIFIVPSLRAYRELLYIGAIKLSFNVLLIEWFFIGLEDFKYITNRSLIIKFLYVISIFIFVHDSSDYILYYILSVSAVVANAAINFFYSKRFVSYSFTSIEIRPYLVPLLIMGTYVLLTNVYTSLNMVWLGFVTNTDEVGYFTTATKLHTIVMAFLTSFASVLFPRMSSLLAEDKYEEYWNKINTSLQTIYLFSFPTVVFLLVAGPDVLNIIVGQGYEGAYLPLQIISPLVIIIGIEQVLVIQILMAMHQDRTVLKNSLIGALACLFLNILLTPRMGAIGSSIVWCISEIIVMIVSQKNISSKYSYNFSYNQLLSYIVAYGVLLLVSSLLYNTIAHTYLAIAVLVIFIVLCTFIIELHILKNRSARQLLNYCLLKWKH